MLTFYRTLHSSVFIENTIFMNIEYMELQEFSTRTFYPHPLILSLGRNSGLPNICMELIISCRNVKCFVQMKW